MISVSIPNDWLRKQAQLYDATDRDTFVGIDVQQNFDLTRPIPVLYGFNRIEPPMIYTSTRPSNPNQLYVVYALAEGQLGPINRVFVNDIFVELPAPATASDGILPHRTTVFPLLGSFYWPSNDVNDKSVRFLEFEYMDGRSQNQRSVLLEEVFNEKLTIPIYDDVATLVVKYTYSEGRFGTSLPKLVVDCFGTVTQDVSQLPTISSEASASTQNPVDHLFDYLTDKMYGCSIPVSSIDETSFKSVRSTIETTTLSTIKGTTYPLWQSGITVDTSRPLRDNINDLIDPLGIILTYRNGKYYLAYEGKDSSYTDLDEAIILDGIQIQIPDADSKFTQFRVNYVDVGVNFEERSVIYPKASYESIQTVYAESLYPKQDGGYSRIGELESQNARYSWYADQIARRLLLKSRNQITYKFRTKREGYQFAVGDIIRISSTVPSITNQKVRIVEMEIGDNFEIDFTVVTHSDDFYPPYSDIVPVIPTKIDFPTDKEVPNPTPAPKPPSVDNPLTPTTTPPTVGTPGAPPTAKPTPPTLLQPVGVANFTMNQIVGNTTELKLTGGTLGAWPNMVNNTDFYLGRIFRGPKKSNLWGPDADGGGEWTTKLDGRNQDYSGYSKSALYHFGCEAEISGASGYGDNGVPQDRNGTIFTFKLAPVITFRQQDTDEYTDPTLGRYKNLNWLFFTYPIRLYGTTYTQGWMSQIGGRYYLNEWNPGLSLTIKRALPGGKINTPYDPIASKGYLPRLDFQRNTNGYGGGWYGGINTLLGSGHLQYAFGMANPSMDVVFPTNQRPKATAAESESFNLSVWAPVLSGKPEYVGSIQVTNWLAAIQGTETKFSQSVANYLRATGRSSNNIEAYS